MGEDRRAPETALTLHQKDAPYPLSRLAPRYELVDLAAEIARADETVSMVASAKLTLIRRQIQALQDEARAVLDEAARAAQLHRARCSFHKVPGHVYHLYRRDDGEHYFSMLSPAEWGGRPPHAYEGSYRLEIDQSYTLVGEA